MEIQTEGLKVLHGRSFAILSQSGVNYCSLCAKNVVVWHLYDGTVPLVSKVSGVYAFLGFAGKAKVNCQISTTHKE